MRVAALILASIITGLTGLTGLTEYLDVNAPAWGVSVQFNGTERGFQSVAFHPDFNRSGAPGFGKFYTYTDTTVVTSNQQPATSNQQPATSNQQPATSNQQPATSNQQPATSNRYYPTFASTVISIVPR